MNLVSRFHLKGYLQDVTVTAWILSPILPVEYITYYHIHTVKPVQDCTWKEKHEICYLLCCLLWVTSFIIKWGCLWARRMKSCSVISYPSQQGGAAGLFVTCTKQSIMNLNSHAFKQSGVSFKRTWSLWRLCNIMGHFTSTKQTPWLRKIMINFWQCHLVFLQNKIWGESAKIPYFIWWQVLLPRYR